MSVVLAAVDDTVAARPVLRTAAAVGHTLGHELRALHVGTAAPTAEAAAAELGVHLTLVAGDPTARIVEAGERPDVELVVLGLHGLPGQHAPGYTARQVAMRLTTPVVVVPPEAPVRAAPRRMLIPLDGNRGVSDRMRPLIARYVSSGVDVLALHVFEPATVPRFLDGEPDAEVWREEFVTVHCGEVDVPLHTRPGPTAAALLAEAHAEDVDVIALGWHQDLSPDRAEVVREVLSRADRPVALVPLPPRGSG